MNIVSILSLILIGLSFVPQDGTDFYYKKKHKTGGVVAAGGTPGLTQFMQKNVVDRNRGGSTTGVNGVVFTLDPTAWPNGVTTGSLVIWSGVWPNNPTTGNGYPHTCTGPCAPTFTDNGTSNTWNAVFTAGTGCKDAGFIANGGDHGIYYAMNFAPPSSTTPTQITETHPSKITDTSASVSAWYNIATTSALRTSSCLTAVTPTVNTAPNISGTALTVVVGDLIYVEIDDQSNNNGINAGSNPFTSITVPSGCTLLGEDTYAGHVEFYCIATSTSFTPQFTIAQGTHDAFTVMAAAFIPGSGGSAPTTGHAAVLVENQLMTTSASTVHQNVGCPTGTTTLIITEDAGSLTGVADSNSDSFTRVGSAGNANYWYKTGISIASPNTFSLTLTVGSSGNVDEITAYCTTATATDNLTVTTGGTPVQVNAYTINNSTTTTSGGADSTYTNQPGGTPTTANDLFIIVGTAGNGPFLTCTQPTGCVMDYPSPTITNACTVTTAGVCGGDAGDYTNGDVGGHYYVTSTSAINWGWSQQNNTSSNIVYVAAFH